MAATAPAQNTFPTTAASASDDFQAAGRASRRAASRAGGSTRAMGASFPRAGAGRAIRPLEDVAVLEQSNELLNEQRIAPGAIEDGSPELGSYDSGIEQLVGECSGGVGRQRPEIDTEGRQVQGRAAVTQLGS